MSDYCCNKFKEHYENGWISFYGHFEIVASDAFSDNHLHIKIKHCPFCGTNLKDYEKYN